MALLLPAYTVTMLPIEARAALGYSSLLESTLDLYSDAVTTQNVYGSRDNLK